MIPGKKRRINRVFDRSVCEFKSFVKIGILFDTVEKLDTKITKKDMDKLRFSTLLNFALVLFLVWGFSSCKSKKKAAEISDPQPMTETPAPAEPEEEVEEEPEPEPEKTAPSKPSASQQLTRYFDRIANANSATQANAVKQEALEMFSSPSAPVLVIIYSSGGQADYDEPTTIGKYMDYLKDTRNADTVVEEMIKDDNGRIKELVLRKK